MKYTLLTITTTMFSIMATAQLVPNPSFEDWTNVSYWDDPTGYFTTNMQSYLGLGESNVHQTSDAHGGYYAAHLMTMEGADGNMPGMLALGTPGDMGIDNPVPFSGSPDSVAFWAKHNIAPNDTSLFGVILYAGDVMVSTAFMVLTGGQLGYMRYATNLTYSGFDVPDGLGFVMFNTDPENAQAGSWVMVDDISFIYNNVNGNPFPNGDFESWTTVQSQECDDWFSSNLYTLGAVSVSQSADAVDGDYSARIESQPLVFDPLQNTGFLLKGTLGPDGLTDGIELDGATMPYAIEGMYKYDPADDTDSASVYFMLSYWDEVEMLDDTLYDAFNYLPAADTWTPFSFAIPENDYLDWEQLDLWPDDLYLGFGSGILTDGDEGFTGPAGSVLYVDDVNVLYDVYEGVEEISSQQPVAFPNPTVGALNFSNAAHVTALRIYDATGKMILSYDYLPKAFNTSHLTPGIYSFELISSNATHRIPVIVTR